MSIISIHCLFVLACQIIPHHWKGHLCVRRKRTAFVYEGRHEMSIRGFRSEERQIHLWKPKVWKKEHFVLDLLNDCVIIITHETGIQKQRLVRFLHADHIMPFSNVHSNKPHSTIILSTWIWRKHGKLYNLLVLMTVITLPSPFTWKLKLIEGNVMRDSISHDSSHQRVKQQ